MELRKAFLGLFILAVASAAAMAIFVVLFGKWSEFEFKVLLTTASIGVYSLIALSCSVVYQNRDWKWLSIVGIIACSVGLVFAILTNWKLIEPEFTHLLRMRFVFLSVAMALAATCLMIAINSRSTVVVGSKTATICLIWITTLLLNMLVFDTHRSPSSEQLLDKFLAISSILGLLGIIATPVLNKIASADRPSK